MTAVLPMKRRAKRRLLPGVSRDASIVACALFASGKVTRLRFDRAHIIHPRTRGAIEELVTAGYVVAEAAPKGAAAWRGTAKLGVPLVEIVPPSKSESFPITTE